MFEEVEFHPRFNQTIYDSAKSKIGDKATPVHVLVLTIDSVSRRNFFRKLPKVSAFLNDELRSTEKWFMYDFKMHNVMGRWTFRNVIPTFFGQVSAKRVRTQTNTNPDERPIWEQLHAQGFVTAFVKET
jgi:hypothetical protein